MNKAVSEIQAKMKTWTDAGIELAYNSGYEQGCKDRDEQIRDAECDFYQRGLDDAWECAKKIYKMTASEIITVFGGCSNWVDYSAFEAIAKVKEYEDKQTDDEYVDAVVKVSVPKWQIGQDVSVFFKDSMNVKGKVESE